MSAKQVTLPITGMTCANCVATVERNLKKLDGVQNAVVNLSSERATVEFSEFPRSAARSFRKGDCIHTISNDPARLDNTLGRKARVFAIDRNVS